MTIRAWRVNRQPDGTLVRRHAMSAPTFVEMDRWLTRTARARRYASRNMWIEDPAQPGHIMPPPPSGKVDRRRNRPPRVRA